MNKRRRFHALRLHQQQLHNLYLADRRIRRYTAKKNKNITFRVHRLSYCIKGNTPDKNHYTMIPKCLLITGDKLSLYTRRNQNNLQFHVSGGGWLDVEWETGEASLLYIVDYNTYNQTVARTQKIKNLLDI